MPTTRAKLEVFLMRTLSAFFFAVSIYLNPVVLADIVSQTSDDARILQAWRGTDPFTLNLAHCTGKDPAIGKSGTKDCSEAAQKLARLPGADRDSPALNSWNLPVDNNGGNVSSRFYVGSLVEIRVVVKSAVLSSKTFSGIGFYYENMLADQTTFVPKDKLHIVSTNDVTLASTGEMAKVLRFTLYMPGEQGNSATGWSMDSVEFKPFAQFDADGKTYQNWDPSAKNYRIYRENSGAGVPQVTTLNFESSLLKK